MYAARVNTARLGEQTWDLSLLASCASYLCVGLGWQQSSRRLIFNSFQARSFLMNLQLRLWTILPQMFLFQGRMQPCFPQLLWGIMYGIIIQHNLCLQTRADVWLQAEITAILDQDSGRPEWIDSVENQGLDKFLKSFIQP